MLFVGLLGVLTSGPALSQNPLLWVSPEGTVLVAGKPAQYRLTKGAAPVETPFGIGLEFDGTRGGLLLPDYPLLAIEDSLTISAWVNLKAYVSDGPGAQILIRGDDRNGLDPYDLVIRPDGTVAFQIVDGKNESDDVSAKIPLNHWVHVTASYNSALSEAKLWLGNTCVRTVSTNHVPFRNLEAKSIPGIGIGNVQNDKGPHNQPLKGTLVDVRLYDAVLTPTQVGWKAYIEK